MLKNVLVIFLTKHKPELMYMIEPHTLSTREFIGNLSYHINTTAEKTKAMMALTNFQRSVGQTFSASITNFETLFSFFIQLDNVVSAEETNRLNLVNLTVMAPHLLSRKSRPIFLDWSKDQIRANNPPTKLEIFRIIESLESNPELQIDYQLRLPRHLIANLLNEHEATLFTDIPV